MAPLFGMGVGVWRGGASVARALRAHDDGPFVNPSWMPHSVSEAAKRGRRHGRRPDLGARVVPPARVAAARRPRSCSSDRVPRDPADMAAGSGTCSSCCRIGIDQALRADVDPVLAVKPSGRRQRLQVGHGLPRLHLHGRAAAGRRDVPHLGQPWHARATSGCSRWPAWRPRPTSSSTSSTSARAAKSTSILSEEPHEGNWLPIAENATILVVRHFFYDWDTEVASSLSIERIGGGGRGRARRGRRRIPGQSRRAS